MAAALTCYRKLAKLPQSVRLRLLIGDVRAPPHDAAGTGTPPSVRLVREDVAAGHLEGGCAAGEDPG